MLRKKKMIKKMASRAGFLTCRLLLRSNSKFRKTAPYYTFETSQLARNLHHTKYAWTPRLNLCSLTSRPPRHPYPNRVRHASQLHHQILVASLIDVINRIAKIPARIQYLPLNVDPAIRQNIVNRA